MDYLEVGRCIKNIQARHLTEGGFAELAGASYRPDATAWAILALAGSGISGEIVETARHSLAKQQLKDGRINMPGDSKAFWPTSFAVLAWQGSVSSSGARRTEPSDSCWKQVGTLEERARFAYCA